MRVPRSLLLALASSPGLVIGKDVAFIHHDGSSTGGHEQPDSPGLTEKFAFPGDQCDTWVGLEKIFMVEFTEVCPDGSTVTETVTECVGTLTRSICATKTTSGPCYPCVMGTPTSTDLATVTMTSCATATEETLTITIQFCSTCTTSIYVGTIPGYTPGGPCHGCTPYGGSASSPSPCTESDADSVGAGGATTTVTTTTTTSTSTSTVSGTDCDDGDSDGTSISTLPGNPGLSSSSTTATTSTTTSAADSDGGTTTTAVATSSLATAAPPVVTAGGKRIGVGGVVVVVLGVGWVLLGVVGMGV